MSYQFVRQHQHQYPVRVMCRVLDVSPSGYYRRCQQPQSRRAQQDQHLLGQIQQVHQQSRQTCGSPKIQQALRQQGIMRLMRQAGLASKRPRCFKRTTQANLRHSYAPNHLQ